MYTFAGLMKQFDPIYWRKAFTNGRCCRGTHDARQDIAGARYRQDPWSGLNQSMQQASDSNN